MPNRRSHVDEVRGQIQDALYGSLIDKIRNDTYPSGTMMDAVEAGMNEQQLADYADALLEKVQGDQYPSLDLIRRLEALAR
jgi:hypothetical protein